MVEGAAALAAAWALLPFVYHVSVYRVEKCAETPALHAVSFVLVLAVLAVSAFACLRRSGPGAGRALAVSWAPLLANLVSVVRAAFGLRPLYIEPLLLSLSVAAALLLSLRRASRETSNLQSEEATSICWAPAAVLLMALAAVVWLYSVQLHFVNVLSYGWRDAGLYYARVKNTALGTLFLQESPELPTFYDHFMPGMLLLVPVYWIARSWKMMLAVQAIALAALGPAVYVYARGRRLGQWTAFLCAATTLVHASISQLAYSFSYGFHPVTLAMPLVVLSVHFWEKRKWAAFAVSAVLAASFEETLFPLYAGIGLVTFAAPLGADPLAKDGRSARVRAQGRAAGVILFVASALLFSVVTKIVMPAVSGREYFQMVKYAHLGDSIGGILLSPILKARVFWGTLFSQKSLVFVGLMLGGMGFLPVLAPRRLLYPGIVLVFILLLEDPNVKSIAFWYQSLVIAAWLPAAVAGIERLSPWRTGTSSRRGVPAAAAMLAAAALLSHFHGLTPFSRATMPFQNPAMQGASEESAQLAETAADLVPRARVLATTREAMIFADVDVTCLADWQGRTDYVLVALDTRPVWGESPEEVRAAFEAFAAREDFEIIPLGRIVVFRRRPFLDTSTLLRP